MNTKILKGLLMALIGAAIATMNTNPIVWSIVIVTVIGTALVYVGKNAIPALQSTAPEGELNWINILSAVLIGVGTAVISGVASIAGSGHIEWTLLWHTVVGVIGTYLVPTLFSGPTKVSELSQGKTLGIIDTQPKV
jgi:hypothetical protein